MMGGVRCSLYVHIALTGRATSFYDLEETEKVEDKLFLSKIDLVA
jgi:hypothetical protein